MTQKDSLILIGAKDGRVKGYMVRLLNTGLVLERDMASLESKLLRSEYQMPEIRTF